MNIIMKKLRKLTGPILFLISAIMFSINVLAEFNDSKTVTNTFQLGDINIGIKEYEIVDGIEQKYTDNQNVMPGDVISKIPRITNYQDPCYIRAKIVIRNLAGNAKLSEKQINISPAWIKRGDFYYYPSPLKKNQSVDLFDQLQIPAEWDKSMQEKTFSVEVIVQAIQSVHYQPEFEADEPWGKETILTCIHEENGTTLKEKNQGSLVLKLDGNSGKILTVPEDFFSNFGHMMPGDVLQDYIRVSNLTEENLRLLFQTDHSKASDLQYELMQKIQLTIYRDDQKIYQGNIASDLLEKEITLYKLRPREQGILSFEIKVPETLDNTYALADGQVDWCFRAETDTEIEEDDPKNGSKARSSGKSLSASSKNKRTTVKTGDDQPIYFWFIMMLFSLIISGISIFSKRGERE